MSLGADVADHISAPGLLKNSPSAQLTSSSIRESQATQFRIFKPGTR